MRLPWITAPIEPPHRATPAWVVWPETRFPAPAAAPPIVTFAALLIPTPPPSFCSAAVPAALVPM